jgi:succinyl-CoA synthetase beta subunit
MNIHEYQAKELFDKFGVPTPKGYVAETPEQAFEAASKLSGGKFVVKSQIHAGGRGKGTFKSGFQGGVHLVDSAEAAQEKASKMLGEVLVTKQTGEAGRLVRKLLIAEATDIAHEYYFSIVLDRATGAPLIVASTEGGMDIETVAEETPEKIASLSVDPLLGLQGYEARNLAQKLGFTGALIGEAAKVFLNVYALFRKTDCSMVEINPLALTPENKIVALDAKFGFDDNALYRHKDILAYRDTEEEDPREVAAAEFNLNYVGLDGNIGCMVNGAGLAMATMDIIKHYGGTPANFLDVGGGASESQVTEAFRLLVSDSNVKAILVNIFGGIMKCDLIAQGIINAAKTLTLSIPLVVRLEGTNVDLGKKLLNESGLNLVAADNLADAAQKVVASIQPA